MPTTPSLCRHARRMLCLTSLLAVTCPAAAQVAAPPRRIIPLALTGQQAPGMPDGVTFLRASSPVVSDAGHLAFNAILQGPGIDETNDSAYLLSPPGSPPNQFRLVAREGDPAPGVPGGSLGHFMYVSNVNSAGQLIIRNPLMGPGISFQNDNQNAVFIARPGSPLQLIARDGDPFPAMPGTYYNSIEIPAINSSGQIGFLGSIEGPGIDGTNSVGYLVGTPDSLRFAWRTSDHAPGFPENVTFQSVGGRGPAPNGRVITYNYLKDAPYNYRIIAKALYTASIDDPTPRLLAATGRPAPGTGPGTLYDEHLVANLNSAGHAVFTAMLQGGDVNPTNYMGIFADDGHNNVRLVLRSGTHAPGTPDGVYFLQFAQTWMNASGHLAFNATLSGPGVVHWQPDEKSPAANGNGVWAGPPNDLRLIARQGDPAPGTGGFTFDSLFYSNGIVLNDAGQVAIYAPISQRQGIWFAEPDGPLELVAWEGLPLQVAEGDWRTPLHVNFIHADNDDGWFSGFNDRGELAFEATFTDGTSGIFLYSSQLRSAKPGDANLDGMVNIDDFFAIDRGRALRLTGWSNGDFTGDGLIDAADYMVIDRAFLSQHAGLAHPASTPVPEPASALLLAAGSLLGRRRIR